MTSFSTAPRQPLQPITMVLVTDQFQCERLIKAGRALADELGTSLEVINVAAAGVERNPQALEFLFQVSKDHGALMMIHYSDDPAKFITRLIRDEMPSSVVTGLPQQQGSLLHRIWTRFETISFYTVEHDGTVRPITLKDRVIA